MARATTVSEPGLVALADLVGERARRHEVGSLVLSLLRLRERGVAVEDCWVIPVHVFRRVVAANVDPAVEPESLLRDIERANGPRRAAEAAEAVGAAAVPAAVRRELASLAGRDVRFVAMPSPTLKDEVLVDAAALDVVEGPLLDSVALEDAIRRIWALAFDEAVLRRLRLERIRELAMAVVVSRVDATDEIVSAIAAQSAESDSAGAVWLTDSDLPAQRSLGTFARIDGRGVLDRMRVALSTPVLPVHGWQAGEPLPSRRRRGGRSIPPQRVPREVAHEPYDHVPCADVVALIRAVDDVDGPRRNVLALGDGGVRLLAAHRIALRAFPSGGDEVTTWSHTLVGDTLPESPTPLSASLYEAFETVAARATSALFGARVARGAGFLQSIEGRPYLNESLLESIARRGVAQDASLVGELTGPPAASIDAVPDEPSLLSLSMAFTRVLGIEQGLEREALQFERDADAYFRWLSEMDLGILPDDGVTTTLLEARHQLLTAWQLRITAVGATAAAAHAARRVLERRLGADALRVARMLEGGSAELASTHLARACHHVAAIAASDALAREALARGAVRTVDLPDGPARRALASFLSAYGDYGPCASELSVARWRENETPLLGLLGAAVSVELGDLDLRLARGRVAVERDLETAQARLSFFERRMLVAALPRLRKLAVLADRAQRLAVRAAAALRAVVVDVDRRLQRRDPALRAGSAFLCRFEELTALLDDPRIDVGTLARQRRTAWLRRTHRHRAPARFTGVPRFEPPSADPLRGVGSGRGVVTGVVRRVTAWDAASLAAVRPGDVVVSDALDPALLPLLFVASALVSRRGSAWTSGLALARELGVPVVVAAGDGVRRLVNGTAVEVDAAGGTVRTR